LPVSHFLGAADILPLREQPPGLLSEAHVAIRARSANRNSETPAVTHFVESHVGLGGMAAYSVRKRRKELDICIECRERRNEAKLAEEIS
jgi:hypothetical protein